MLCRRITIHLSLFCAISSSLCSAFAADSPTLPIVKNVELQPLVAQVRRVIEAADYLGSPLSAADRKTLEAAFKKSGADEASEAIQRVLDRYCLFGVNINPESRVKVAPGAARPELVEKGWRQFLVKVHNEAGVTAELRTASPNALSLFESGSASTSSDKAYRKRGDSSQSNPAELWLDLQMFNKQPLRDQLSGLNLEYRILQLYSRDAGQREAKISFNVGQGTQDIGYRNDVDVLFTSLPASDVKFHLLDEEGKPTTLMLVIRDKQGRVHPSQAKRLAPDFSFHPQVYRADGETVRLPAGEYTFTVTRGPESLAEVRAVKIGAEPQKVDFQIKRWIDPSKMGWWSGDHHIHAAGCAHYVKPTEGVLASDMIRQCKGEDLKVGANLTW